VRWLFPNENKNCFIGACWRVFENAHLRTHLQKRNLIMGFIRLRVSNLSQFLTCIVFKTPEKKRYLKKTPQKIGAQVRQQGVCDQMVQIGPEQCIRGGALEVQRLEPGWDKVFESQLSEHKSRFDSQEVITGFISVWQQGQCGQIVHIGSKRSICAYREGAVGGR
jgi:hypothetical protein